jgi:hypothetical protein
MSIRRIAYSSAWLLAGIVVLCLGGCQPPELLVIDPEGGLRGQQVQLNLDGEFFTDQSAVFVDGTRHGFSSDGVRVDSVTFVVGGRLTATLTLAPDARLGDHPVVVGDLGGFSLPVQFRVSCSGCFPPELLRINHRFLVQGETYHDVTLVGRLFKEVNVRIGISGTGITASEGGILSHDDENGYDYFALYSQYSLKVAADAPTGLRNVTISTDGGMSSPLQVNVYPPNTVLVGFFDGDFDHLGEYWTGQNFREGSFTSFVSGEGFGDGEYPASSGFRSCRETDQVFGAGQSIIVAHTLSSAVYVPSGTGAIASIAFSFDVKFLGGSTGTSQVTHRLVLEQNGSVYYSNAYGVAQGPGNGAPGVWQPFSFMNLTASDFTALVGQGVPDFSATANPITFGYLTSNSGTADNTQTRSGIDNWRVTIVVDGSNSPIFNP